MTPVIVWEKAFGPTGVKERNRDRRLRQWTGETDTLSFSLQVSVMLMGQIIGSETHHNQSARSTVRTNSGLVLLSD